MRIAAKILSWNAWAPGYSTQQEWMSLAATAAPLDTLLRAAEQKAPAEAIAPMLRRRLTSLGRAVAQTAFSVPGAMNESATALVFASRWGDVQSSLTQMKALVSEQSVSPGVFATSVHNGIAATLTIAAQHTGAVSAVAGGPFSFESGFIEAAALLSQSDQVLLSVYEGKTPEDFEEQTLRAPDHSLSMLLVSPKDPRDLPLLTLETLASDSEPSQQSPALYETLTLTHDLDVLFFLLAPADETNIFQAQDRALCWRWERSEPLTQKGAYPS